MRQDRELATLSSKTELARLSGKIEKHRQID